MPEQTEKQDIETLKARYEKLNESKIRAEQNLKNAETHLVELKKKAKAEFGTDDVTQLKKQLKEMESDNETKRAEYQSQLDSIESRLSTVKEKYSESESTDNQ